MMYTLTCRDCISYRGTAKSVAEAADAEKAHAREKPGHSLLRHKVRCPAASTGRRLNKKSM
jgi:hypothetical protein